MLKEEYTQKFGSAKISEFKLFMAKTVTFLNVHFSKPWYKPPFEGSSINDAFWIYVNQVQATLFERGLIHLINMYHKEL